jgi:hypothetical protein
MFKNLILILNFLKDFKILGRLIQKFIQFFPRKTACVCTNRLFPDRLVFKKIRELLIFELTGLEGAACAVIWWIFSSNKSAPAKYRNKGFYTGRLPKNEKIRGIFILRSKEL